VNTDWVAAAILPNLRAKQAIDGGIIALVPSDDPRVQASCDAHPKLKAFLSRFTDAFGVPLLPAVLIVRDGIPGIDLRAIVSFRDVVSVCAIPYGRALASIYPNGGLRLSYSNSFWLYPWMLGKDNEYLYINTPGVMGSHVVEKFHGQSSPEIPLKTLDGIDKTLLDALLSRWKRHYVGKRSKWSDIALFRSLNMAMHAAELPGGSDTFLYDLGRMAALWVSAFEILSHPGTSKSNLWTVYSLLEKASYSKRQVGNRRYAAYSKGKKPWPRRPLTCWLYGKLYRARNDFVHGNRVTSKTLQPIDLRDSLFWFAPGLFRIALTGFLGLTFKGKEPEKNELQAVVAYQIAYRRYKRYQDEIEEALLQTRKT